ncbi:MAG TPA: hypothetical protein VFO55_01520 [Gemmatimonadaceae bacterium]|nr:hypothetical protein [Gemmatimonadaceae bacterium]
MNFSDGGVAEMSFMFQIASPASNHPAFSPTRGSGDGAAMFMLGAGEGAATSGAGVDGGAAEVQAAARIAVVIAEAEAKRMMSMVGGSMLVANTR